MVKTIGTTENPAQTPAPTVLMLTAMAEPIDKVRGFAFGADAYMTKPFDSAELLRTVRLLLGSPEELTKDQSAYHRD